MFLNSLAYRVVTLHAEEGRHEICLAEIRRPVATSLLNATAAGLGPVSPPCCLTVPVTPDQFANIRIGDVFELSPNSAPKCDVAVSPYSQMAAPVPSVGLTGTYR